jgi:UDP-glucose 4-epimerase
MHILITGGAGFVGSHLAEAFVNDGARVTVLDNLSRGSLLNLAGCGRDLTCIEADIRDLRITSAAMRGIDVVYHLAAVSRVVSADRDPDETFTTNVIGTYNVLQAAKATGVKKVIFTSSREVYGEADSLPVNESGAIQPKNAYGASKAAGEAYCLAQNGAGYQTVVLRLSNVYGPRDFDRVIPTFLARALARLPLVVFGGAQIIDFIEISVVVDALMKAIHIREVRSPINVASGVPTTILELARRLTIECQSDSRVELTAARCIEVTRFVGDVTRMRSVLGLEPPHDPLAGLPRLVAQERIARAATKEHQTDTRRD